MTAVESLLTTRVAAVGLELTTAGDPPLIVEVVIYHVDAGAISDGPFCYWAGDASLSQVRIEAWPNVRLAPLWHEVAGRVMARIGNRVLAVHDQHRADILL